MNETVRAFLAIELPAEVKTALAALVEQLKDADINGLRPVNPGGIHLTLRFLGNVPIEQVQSVVEVVSRTAARYESFAIRLGVVGAFPGGGAARVLWVGLEGKLSSLAGLQERIEDDLDSLGFRRERRAYRPHLTVARIRDGTPDPDRRRAREALFSASLASGLSIDCDSVSLMRSILSPQGARYERLALMTLASRAV